MLERLLPVMHGLVGDDYEVIFVNDGSGDETGALLDAACAEHPQVRALHFSRNFGHQPALTAGMDAASGEALILLDCDLQDPPEVLPAFVERWRQGHDVVYGVRQKRKESIFKRAAYSVFYRTLRAMAQVDVPLDAGDFCLMDRKVVDVLRGLPETHRFLRGLRTWVGFKQASVEYERSERFAGTPKYTLGKLLQLALTGYIGFSIVPLRLAVWLGALAALGGAAVFAWVMLATLTGASAPRGWASVIAVVLSLGGAQLIVLSIIGEYLGRMYDEVRRRPVYIVDRRAGWQAPTRDDA